MREIIGNILITICILTILFCLWQFVRIEAVYRIRSKWIDTSDKRWYKYSYHQMCGFGKLNWFGLRLPRDKHFK